MGRLGYLRRLASELFAFAAQNKAYWIIPLLLVLALATLLAVAATTSSPYVYTLF